MQRVSLSDFFDPRFNRISIDFWKKQFGRRWRKGVFEEDEERAFLKNMKKWLFWKKKMKGLFWRRRWKGFFGRRWWNGVFSRVEIVRTLCVCVLVPEDFRTPAFRSYTCACWRSCNMSAIWGRETQRKLINFHSLWRYRKEWKNQIHKERSFLNRNFWKNSGKWICGFNKNNKRMEVQIFTNNQ